MTNSIIAIKGEHLNRAAEIFEAFGYVGQPNDLNFGKLEELYAYCSSNMDNFSDQEISLRGIWQDNGWTIIFDPETIDFANEEALSKISGLLGSEVFTFVIQTTSGSFGFSKYAPTNLRSFFSSGRIVDPNYGTPLPEEEGLNINEQVFIDDITSLAGKLGIDIEGQKAKNITLKQLGYSDQLKKELEAFESPTEQRSPTAEAKPWWKFW
ncbi:hypothetical protein [Mucilaginibacter pedocola]|uniref:Uncharacterized protein n=1 Tax=Mucilaginibacter pedocola TaxID=1792845 RepID=A0A1S9PAG8_9SPHI|nr:hypothetical protein [Mucilaginibacter pedocola]OOQ57945.1 hypothetical protein BC343_09715 [Mucilaginibacter pedocola]